MQHLGPTPSMCGRGVGWQSCVASLAGPGSAFLLPPGALHASLLGLELAAELLQGACSLEGDLLVVAAHNNNNKNPTEESAAIRAKALVKSCSWTPSTAEPTWPSNDA